MIGQKLKYLFLILYLPLFAQQDINQYDQDGRRQGEWKVNFEGTSQTKFEGQFEHGKEKGEFKFYKKGVDKFPTAIMQFKEDSPLVAVTYYTQNGHPISEGHMLNKQREGLWVYYHKNSPDTMMTEHYKGGQLRGEQLTYFPNGQLAEKSYYENGQKDGESFIYTEKGQLLRHLNYTNGELNGPAQYYNNKGEKVIEGQYVDDQKKGTWKYYENGELKEKKEY
ncbi:MAG: aspartic peptidase [Salegentibacter sp.]